MSLSLIACYLTAGILSTIGIYNNLLIVFANDKCYFFQVVTI